MICFKLREYTDRIELKPTFFGWLLRKKVIIPTDCMTDNFAMIDEAGKINYRKR